MALNQPSKWEWVNFEEAVEIWDSLRKPINSKERAQRISDKNQEELYPYYGATGQVGYIDSYLSDGEYVLLGEDGAPFLDPVANKAYLIQGKAWVNNHAHVLRSKYNNKFLCYYLNQFNYNGFVTGTTRYKLTQAAMKRIPIPVPSPDEQERIVSKIEELFSRLDASVAELQTAKEKLKVYRQAVLKEAFDPVCTEYVSLGDMIEKPRYGTSKKCSYAYNDTSKAVYRIPNIRYQDGTIDHRDIKYASFSDGELNNLELLENDILIIRSNGSVSLVGRSSIIRLEDYNATFAGYLIRLRLKNASTVSAKFLHYFLESHAARTYIENIAKSTSGVNNINSDEICHLPVPKCDNFEMQAQIVEKIETHLSICDNIEQAVDTSLQKAATIRQSILKQAFEGKL